MYVKPFYQSDLNDLNAALFRFNNKIKFYNIYHPGSPAETRARLQSLCLTKRNWGVALSSSTAWPKLCRSVIETFFYIEGKRACLGRALQVPEQSCF
jgi:hypothetical protein